MPDEHDLPILLPEQALEDIADLLKHRQHISAVAKAAAGANPAGNVPRFFQNVAKSSGLPLRVVRDIVFALWSISRLRLARSTDKAELVAALAISFEQNASDEWQAKNLPLWNEVSADIAKALETFIDDHPFSISQKAQSLAFVHQNVLTSARLITDVRPVFDTAGEKILETVIVHTLSIQYSTGHNPPATIDFALDAEDVRSLLRACQRAEAKIKTTTTALKDLNPIVFPQ